LKRGGYGWIDLKTLREWSRREAKHHRHGEGNDFGE